MQIENNGPALLKVLINQAKSAVWQNKPTEAMDILEDANNCAQQMLDWFQLLRESNAIVPLGWTEFVNMRNKKRGVP